MYNHAPAHYICPFCSLIRGHKNEHVLSVPDDIIYQDEYITAFIGSHQWPNNHGNVIIVPNEHFENIYDLPSHYAEKIHRLAQKIALAMKVVYACAGVSTRQHNEPGGNQDVWHYHLHVTPRYHNDRYYGSPREFMPADQRAIHAEKLRNHLTEGGNEMEYELRPEYDLQSLRVRRVGPARTGFGGTVVQLAPDVAELFPNSEAVNEALRFLIRVTRDNKPLPEASITGD